MRFFNQLVLIIFTILGLSACRDDCPFDQIEVVQTHSKDSISVNFGVEVLAEVVQIKKLPITLDGVLNLSTSLNTVVDEYRTKPVNTELASIYNVKVEKVCGLYRLWKEAGGKPDSPYAQKMTAAIEELYTGIEIYVEKHAVCRDGVKYRTAIRTALNRFKGRYDPTEWEKKTASNAAYEADCERQADCVDCYQKYLRLLQSQ